MIGVGSKVKCVKVGPWVDSNTNKPVNDQWTPIFGNIYTVTRIEHKKDGEDYLGLYEAPHQIWVYNTRQFRPIDTRKTDISVFTAMLNKDKINA